MSTGTIVAGGDILCGCGNTPDADGFYPAHPNGTWASTDPDDPTADPPAAFRFGLYRCASCDAVHDYHQLEKERRDRVVSPTNQTGA